MIEYYDYWNYLGHTYSECLYNEKIKNIYISIPKNASTYIRRAMPDQGFTAINYLKTKTKLDVESVSVVLRDPIDRWISGITTYLNLNIIKDQDVFEFLEEINSSKNFLDLLFNKVVFDDHTEKQTYFLQPFDLTNCCYFYLNDLFDFRFAQFYLGEGLKIVFDKEYSNFRKDDPVHKFFTEFLFDAKNQDYKNRLTEFYVDDFNLIKTIKFYGT